jgi:hypothetical protein
VGLLKEARDEVMKEAEDTRRRLEVLTQFFNKKEAELQKQLGLQSVRCSITVIYSSKKKINKSGGRRPSPSSSTRRRPSSRNSSASRVSGAVLQKYTQVRKK